MALSLRDKEIESRARQVANLTGETLTGAVRGRKPPFMLMSLRRMRP
jgi:hypothetical protein